MMSTCVGDGLSNRDVRGHGLPTMGATILKISLFGAFRVRSASGDDIVFPRRKTRAVLAMLAAADGAPVPRSQIAGVLWDLVPEEQARNSFRGELNALGRILGQQSLSPILATRNEVQLPAEYFSTEFDDLDGFDDVEDGSTADPLLPAGRPLEGLSGISGSFDDWLTMEVSRLENRVLRWHESRLELMAERRAPAPSILRAARALLAFDITHERAWRIVVESLISMGDMGQARKEAESCRAALRRTLDIEPSSETAMLFRRLDGPRSPGVTADPGQPPTTGYVTPLPTDTGWVSRHRASIVVMPFTHDAAQPAQAFLASGIHEGIVHNLSGIGELFVTARATAMSFAKAGRLDPRQIGQELNVRYVLGGAITASGDRLRAYVELVEAETAGVLQTEILEIAPSDVFQLQDHLSANVVAAIAPSVREFELTRAQRKPAQNLTSYENLLKGLDLLYDLDHGAFENAGTHLRQAVELDPGFAAPRSHLATWHNFRIGQGWSPDPMADVMMANDLAEGALSIDPRDATALAIKGQVLAFTQRAYGPAREHLDLALKYAPSNPFAWTLSSATHTWTGHGRLAVQHATRAIDLSPRDPFVFFAEHMISQGHYVSGDYELAIVWGRRAAARNDRLTSNLRTLAAAYVAAGKMEAATKLAAQIMRAEPGFRVGSFVSRTPFDRELRETFGARLLQAGLPE